MPFPGCFTECEVNINGQYCEEILDTINDDPDVQNCTSQNTCSDRCMRAIDKVGLLLIIL